jgi:hypothetical protein
MSLTVPFRGQQEEEEEEEVNLVRLVEQNPCRLRVALALMAVLSSNP